MLVHTRLPVHTPDRCTNQLNMEGCNMTAAALSWSASSRKIPSVNTTTRKMKSVHFADTKGLALVSTFFFTRETPSLESISEYGQIGRITFRRTSCRQTKCTNSESARLLNYKSPIPSKEFEENIEKNNVCLEKTYCNRNGVYGRIQVKNIAFEKDISVRYTFDSWAAVKEMKARYIPGASIADTDTFFFHVPPPGWSSGDQKMEFAICYTVDGETYWDNNFGDNYRLLYLSSS